MIKKKNELVMIFVIIAVISINQIVFSKYTNDYGLNGTGLIAKPIIVLKKDNLINKKIDQNSFPIEYYFYIDNFDDNGNINEVDFDYTISIENSKNNFPVKYILYDCNNEKEIILKDGTSKNLKLQKNQKESRKFKVVFQWRELNNNLDNKVEIKLKINAVESKVV